MSIVQSVFDAAARGIILFAIAAFVAWLLRNRDARSRHLIWTAAIIGQFALLAFVNLPARWHVSVPISVLEGSTRATSNATQHQVPVVRVHTDERTQSIQFVRKHLRTPVIWYVAGSIWLLGLVLGTVRVCWGTFQLWRFAIHAQRVIDGSWLSLVQGLADTLRIARPMTLLMGYPSAVPITWGFVYPVLLLPNEAKSWNNEERYIILMHEMHHVRRLDALTQLVAQLATIVFWFSPFVWIAARYMRRELEHSCDEAILDSGITPSHYAEVLVNIARSLSRNNQPPLDALAAVGSTEMGERVTTILAHSRGMLRLRTAELWILSSCLMCFSAGLGLLIPRRVEAAIDHASTIEATCLVSQRGVVDVALSVPRPGSVSNVGANSGNRTVLATFDGKDCPTVFLSGEADLTSALDDVSGISPQGSLLLLDPRHPNARKIIITARNGTIMHQYIVAGVEQPWSEGEGWFAEQFAHVVRDNGYDAPSRVKALMDHGGIAAVLEECERSRSDSGKYKLLDSLMRFGAFDRADRDKIVQTISTIESKDDRNVLLTQLGGLRTSH